MFRKILVANDGSEGAARALDAGLRLARSSRASVHMICVEEVQWLPATREEVIGDKDLADRRFAEVVAGAEAAARRHRIKLHSHVVVGHVVQAIVEFIASHRFDLLVVGFMGHSALYNRVIGGTTDRLVEHAPCTVMVVK
jgi:nucleotide-binding universal stress UspA family protein